MKVQKIKSLEEVEKLMSSGKSVYVEVENDAMFEDGVLTISSRQALEDFVSKNAGGSVYNLKSFESYGVKKIVVDCTNAKYMFSLFKHLEELPVVDASKVVVGTGMFQNMGALQKVDELVLRDVVYANAMFQGCMSLVEVGGDVLDVQKLKYVEGMFNDCKMLQKIPKLEKSNWSEVVYKVVRGVRKDSAAEYFFATAPKLKANKEIWPEFYKKRMEALQTSRRYEDDLRNDWSDAGRRRWYSYQRSR